MIKEFKKPDLNAPRCRTECNKVLNTKFLKEFTKKHPKYKDLSIADSKKILEVAEHIKTHALAWSVTYNDETVVDKINIRQAVLSSMHSSIKNVIDMESKNKNEYFLLVDGNDFKPYMRFHDDEFTQVANRLKKQTFIEQVIIKHEHPDIPQYRDRFDELYKRNNRYY